MGDERGEGGGPWKRHKTAKVIRGKVPPAGCLIDVN